MRRLPALAVALALGAGPLHADDVLQPGAVNVDRPTVVTLGVQLLISGDDDHDAAVAVRYRPVGATVWRQGLPLFRVHPESVVGRIVPEQFAGSIFDLVPATSYEVELVATDPDGPVDVTIPLVVATRGVPPSDPQNPVLRPVATAAALRTALSGAAPGHVITLASGAYAGQFVIQASGTAANPIVIRGGGPDTTALDGGGCGNCNVLEVYGSFVHVEDLTIRHAQRGLRFQGAGTEGNVVRRVRMTDVRMAIGSRQDQRDFYLCDNTFDGRLTWPQVYADDNGAHSNDDGIRVEGNGHVVCHNRIAGFGDALKVAQTGARGVDFYGNDVLWTYDDGLELDGSEGNTRAFRNRFTNTYDTLSFQPIYGGPAYALRNVVVNVVNEQLKFHGLGTVPPQEPSGIFVLHNTFVRPAPALNVQTSATSHHFLVANNIFVGPSPVGPRVVDWSGPIDDGVFDYNGWFPDGRCDFGAAGDWPSFAAMQAAGVFENGGLRLAADTFASGLLAPTTYQGLLAPQDVTLADTAAAVDQALALPNVNDLFAGGGPDLGALEQGCPLPVYGVRPPGVDETNEPFWCGGPVLTTTTTVPTTTSTSTTSTTLPWVLVGTRTLKLADRSTPPVNPSARRVLFIAASRLDAAENRIVPPVYGSAADPTLGGGSLSVYNSAGGGEAVTVLLPAFDPVAGAGWSLVGSTSSPRGYRFRSTSSADPINNVLVLKDRIVVKGGGAAWGYTLDEPAQGRIAVRLTLGAGVPWCADVPPRLLGTPPSPAASDRVDRFRGAPKTPPPASCPPLP
jgi:hypothetical protein